MGDRYGHQTGHHQIGYDVGYDVTPLLPDSGHQDGYQLRHCGFPSFSLVADGYEITTLGAPATWAVGAGFGGKTHEADKGTPWGAAAAPSASTAAEGPWGGARWSPSQGSHAMGHGSRWGSLQSPADWFLAAGGDAEGAEGSPQSLADWVALVGPPGSERPALPGKTEAIAEQEEEPQCLAALREDIIRCCGFMRVEAIQANRRRRARRATYQFATSLNIFVSGLSEEGGSRWRGPLLLGVKSILERFTNNTCQIRNDKLYVTDVTRDAVIHVSFFPFLDLDF